MTCPYCNAYGCANCNYTGQMHGAPTSKAKVAGPKVGDVHADACKRCKNAGSVRVLKVELDKMQLFCKLCGKEAEVKR